MINIHNIIAVGGHEGNQARFLTQIEPVKLKEDAEIAVTSIFHGQIFNITNSNNKIYFNKIDDEISSLDPSWKPDLEEQQLVVIPPGFYYSSYAICLAIEEKLIHMLPFSRKNARIAVTYDKHRQIVQLRLNNLYLRNTSDSPCGGFLVIKAILAVHITLTTSYLKDSKFLYLCTLT